MPQRQKFEFTGHAGNSLAALLETPDQEPIAVALFAHCFTCGKDIAAASRIARSLVARGYAVMRFDFTGLGNSDGDFANTNFSSNVQDLVEAANHLRERDMAPSLLIGHSLGGTAVLSAAHAIPECVGVVTIGSPADAQHVSKQFACDIETINAKGEAEVDLAGRKFTIKKQFLDDISATTVEHIGRLKPALLVMHSPVDATVSIREAERIYIAAKHPKSFVSLDNADHLLTRGPDAEYVASIVTAWAGQRVAHSDKAQRPKLSAGEVLVSEKDHRFMLEVLSDSHRWVADETLRMYAERKKWPLTDAKITLRHAREHLTDCENCEDKPQQLDVIEREIVLVGDLDDAQRARLMQIADKCPVHRTLTGQLTIRTSEVSSAAT